MAQDFRRFTSNAVGTSAVTIFTANSFDTVVDRFFNRLSYILCRRAIGCLCGYYINAAGTSSEMTRRQSRRVISKEKGPGRKYWLYAAS